LQKGGKKKSEGKRVFKVTTHEDIEIRNKKLLKQATHKDRLEELGHPMVARLGKTAKRGA